MPLRPPATRLSPATQKLVDELHKRRSRLDKIFDPDDRVAIVREIGASGEPEVILDLLPIVSTGKRPLVEETVRAIQRLLVRLSPLNYAQFDLYVRVSDSNSWERSDPWYRIRPHDVAYLASLGTDATEFLGIASSHPSDYVRESALRELSKLETGAEVPFLLMRVGDWVENVRVLAREPSEKRVTQRGYCRIVADDLR
jgi:HEAT repeat protein